MQCFQQVASLSVVMKGARYVNFFAPAGENSSAGAIARLGWLPPEKDRQRDQPADAGSNHERDELAVLVAERRLDGGREYPELGEIDHHENRKPRLPYGGASAGLRLIADAVF